MSSTWLRVTEMPQYATQHNPCCTADMQSNDPSASISVFVFRRFFCACGSPKRNSPFVNNPLTFFEFLYFGLPSKKR